jgi:O-glycosyl hydrolase
MKMEIMRARFIVPERRRSRLRNSFAQVLAIFCLSSFALAQQTHIVLDGNATGRTFDGLGAASAGASSRLLYDYPEPERSQILDYLFRPGYGAALQRLKVEVGADVNSTDGSEPGFMRTPSDHNSTRGYEWWLMTEAHKRNPNIILEILPWGAPRWVDPKASAPGAKPTLYTPQMAAYMADFIKTAKRGYGLDIRYAGLWNEKVYDLAYLKELHRALIENHLATKIVCCDEYPGEGAGQWDIANVILKDPSIAADVAAIGVHYPKVNGRITTTEAARRTGKPLWSSEDQPNGGSGPFLSRDWPIGGRILAQLYNQNYLDGSLTATEIWSPVTAYYDILAAPNSGLMYANTPWSGHYDVQGAIWATAHTTQFAQPGWQYLDSASGFLPNGGTYVSLRSPDRKNWSVILETIAAHAPQSVSFRIAGGLAATTVHIWQTGNTRTFEHIADVAPENGAFAYIFAPDSLYSLTTTTGQGKGAAQPPPAAPFPLPYEDNFDAAPLGRAPRYLSDQDGAFEVHRCADRAGRCLEQVITTPPIPWGPLPDPFTLAGDASWSDYSVSADVRFLSASAAAVMGRIDSADVFRDGRARWPSGYILRIEPGGAWELLSAEYKKPPVTLATGAATLDRARWHRLGLRFQGRRITAWLDGARLAAVEDGSHAHGMFALGSEWGRTQFDNLRVAP